MAGLLVFLDGLIAVVALVLQAMVIRKWYKQGSIPGTRAVALTGVFLVMLVGVVVYYFFTVDNTEVDILRYVTYMLPIYFIFLCKVYFGMIAFGLTLILLIHKYVEQDYFDYDTITGEIIEWFFSKMPPFVDDTFWVVMFVITLSGAITADIAEIFTS